MAPPANILNQTLRSVITDEMYTKFFESLQTAAARLEQVAKVDGLGRVRMVDHMRNEFELYILHSFSSDLHLEDPQGRHASMMTRQQALEWDAESPAEGTCFYHNALSKIPKGFSTVWEKVRCHQRPMEELKVIDGKDVALIQSYDDRMVLGKIITPVKSGLSLSFHIEDPSGAAFPVVIRFPTPIPHFSLSLPDTLAKLYPIGAILVIKSPRTGFLSGGRLGITVDTPYEIEELHPNDPFLEGVKWQDGLEGDAPKGWKKYKDAGNGEMRKGNPLVALRLHSLALSDPEVKSSRVKTFKLLLNRTEAYLALDLHGAAYRDANRARETIESNDIALTSDERDRLQLRLAKAALGHRLYNAALQACDQASPKSLLSEEIQTVKERVQMRLKEQKFGVYDWMALFRESLEAPLMEMDVADHMSPACQVAQVPGCGRGVIAARDIVPGELIMAIKEVASSCAKIDSPGVYVNCIDAGSLRHVPYDVYTWIYRLVFKLHDDPSLITHLTNLYSEVRPSPPGLPRPEDEDTRHACALRPTGFKLPDLSLDLQIMFVRTTKHIPQGDEILMSYIQENPSQSSRLLDLANWNIDCACTLCRADSSPDDDHKRRGQLMKVNRGLLNSTTVLFSEVTKREKEQHRRKAEDLEKLARDVEQTYARDRRQDTKGHLAEIYHIMGRDYFSSGQEPKAIEALIHSLKYTGVTLTTLEQERQLGRKVYDSHSMDEHIFFDILVLAMMEGARDPEEGSKWARSALWMHDVKYGGGLELFMVRYGDFVASSDIMFDWLG
ncbi:hypothetical protein I350_02590 [Cryptococcus amylolentus CBS 6273]|uniref:SET domain-containing protein n=1 Tax=Cryptococcus amylolentus CBS 6273 TaxID=1296118 RepID=A0A1E3K8Z8_9TREE|nr:hypothetical protein I350_02590 [Cryptococcus amylolentus CBS 6273]